MGELKTNLQAALVIMHVSIFHTLTLANFRLFYRAADKSLARPTSRCILFDGEV